MLLLCCRWEELPATNTTRTSAPERGLGATAQTNRHVLQVRVLPPACITAQTRTNLSTLASHNIFDNNWHANPLARQREQWGSYTMRLAIASRTPAILAGVSPWTPGPAHASTYSSPNFLANRCSHQCHVTQSVQNDDEGLHGATQFSPADLAGFRGNGVSCALLPQVGLVAHNHTVRKSVGAISQLRLHQIRVPALK